MKYSYQAKSFVISENELKNVMYELVAAIRSVRRLSNLPMDKHKRDGKIDNSDMAQIHIIKAGKMIGIDFGCEDGNDLDVRLNVDEK